MRKKFFRKYDTTLGNPVETEEMRPAWFDLNDIPYSSMWQNDKKWCSAMIDNYRYSKRGMMTGKGIPFSAYFSLDADNKIIKENIKYTH